MKTQKQQKEISEQFKEQSIKWREAVHENLFRQSRGRPEPTENKEQTESKTILNHINSMRTRKRRKRSPGLLRYSSRKHDEALDCQHLQTEGS